MQNTVSTGWPESETCGGDSRKRTAHSHLGPNLLQPHTAVSGSSNPPSPGALEDRVSRKPARPSCVVLPNRLRQDSMARGAKTRAYGALNVVGGKVDGVPMRMLVRT